MSTLPADPDRAALRQRLLSARQAFVASSDFLASDRALRGHLVAVLARLEPDCLGLYWPMRGEFNAALRDSDDPMTLDVPRALPYATREPVALQFRRWDGATPTAKDDCGIPTADGEAVVPDVVLVPCLGFAEGGFRLGYGGGYYDRFLAAHPHVTAIGIAWSIGRLPPGSFVPEPHDVPLMAVVTEDGVLG